MIPYGEAKRRKSANARGRWKQIAGELEGVLWPTVTPSFRIRPGDTVFTIGSCFARNIEANLAALGCKAPMLDFRLPAEEFDGAPNAAMNRFHPPAFRQCLEWAARIHDRDGRVCWKDCEPLAFDIDEGRYFDLDMAAAMAVPKARFIERRQHIYDIFSTAFTADCMMMTPGFIEAWRDLRTGLYTCGPPYHKAMLATPERWRCEILSYAQCLDELLGAVDVVRARNPAVDILITTSPVPLSTTFSGRDITVANCHSKAVLRAVCDAVTAERERIDYFPSYEMVTLSNPALAWKADRLHVSQGFISKIVAYMLDHYMEGVDAAANAFQQARALLADDRVLEAESSARAALEADPNHREAKALLGAALVRQHRWAEAEAILSPIAAADPERCDVRVQLARAIIGDGRVEEAAAELEDVISRSSLTPADVLAAQGVLKRLPPEDWVRLARKAVELFPLNADVYPGLATALARAGRKAEAVDVLQHIIEIAPAPHESHLLARAQLLADLGRNDEALAQVRMLLARDPKHAEGRVLMEALRSTALTVAEATA